MSESDINLDTPLDLSQHAAQITNAAITRLASVPQTRVSTCLSIAVDIALKTVQRFEPRYAGVPEVKWCGPQGQPAPPMTFPLDFVDRRTTIASALYGMAMDMSVDVPIFSAQARVTLHRDMLATFSNFNAPAATVISSLDDSASILPIEIPDPIRRELDAAENPVVHVVLNQMASFEDVILYTSISNFSRAFAAFQTGPWRSLKHILAEQRIFDGQSCPLIEQRAIERAAFVVVEQAWEVSWRQPLDRIRPLLIGLLARVQAGTKA